MASVSACTAHKSSSPVAVERSDKFRQSQFGRRNVTNASHIVDWDTAKRLCPTVHSEAELDALTRLLNCPVNLPIKTRAENIDLVLDREIQAALDSGASVSPAAFERAMLKIGVLKGLGKEYRLQDDTIAKLVPYVPWRH